VSLKSCLRCGKEAVVRCTCNIWFCLDHVNHDFLCEDCSKIISDVVKQTYLKQ
jgi:hypothetical protein